MADRGWPSRAPWPWMAGGAAARGLCSLAVSSFLAKRRHQVAVPESATGDRPRFPEGPRPGSPDQLVPVGSRGVRGGVRDRRRTGGAGPGSAACRPGARGWLVTRAGGRAPARRGDRRSRPRRDRGAGRRIALALRLASPARSSPQDGVLAGAVIELVVEVDGRVDQRQVGERLRKLPSCSPVSPISSEPRSPSGIMPIG
jgi:hypothetical protein